MKNPFGTMWMLGSVSPFEVLRGMFDMSSRWSHGSPLLSTVRIVLIVAAIGGVLELLWNPVRGVAIAGIGMLALYAIRRQ